MSTKNLHIKLAKALLAVASQEKIEDTLLDQLSSLKELLHNNDLQNVLKKVSYLEFKHIREFVSEAFEKHFHTLIVNLLILLVAHRATSVFPLVHRTYRGLYLKKHNIDDITFVTARELSDKEKDYFKSKFEHERKSPFKIQFTHDDKLFAGVQMYENGKLMDMSAKHRLEIIRRELLKVSL